MKKAVKQCGMLQTKFEICLINSIYNSFVRYH